MKYITWKIVQKVTESVFSSSDVRGENKLMYWLNTTTTTGNGSPIFVYWDKQEAIYSYGFYTPSPNEDYFILEGYSTVRPVRINTLAQSLYWPSLDLARMKKEEVEAFWKSCHAGSPPFLPAGKSLVVTPEMWGVPEFTPERIIDIQEE